MSEKMFFLLGAHDPEMLGISSLLGSLRIPYAHAESSPGVRCRRHDAYEAKTCGLHAHGRRPVRMAIPRGHTLVFVECSMPGVTPDLVADHHNPGDPGYDKGSSDFMSGSSLGQVLDMLGVEPSQPQRMLCAADHCLSAAYAGLCPGIDPGELLHARASWRSVVSRRPLADILSDIESTASVLRSSVEPSSGFAVFDDPFATPPELPEASAYAGVPVRYVAWADCGGLKECVKGCSPSQTSAYMAAMSGRGLRVYGNPHRGYAGAYL